MLAASWKTTNEQEPEIRERLEHAEQRFPGSAQDIGSGSYQGGQLLYGDRHEHEQHQDSQSDQDQKGDQYREPPRHHTREVPHRGGRGHRQREAAKQHDRNSRAAHITSASATSPSTN